MRSRSEPLTVEVRRGPTVESRHLVHAAISGPERPDFSWGEYEQPTMPRSAIKSIQLLPMLTTGAADAFDVTDDEIALAASSHGAEPLHVDAVRSWLARIGLDEAALECGPAPPITDAAAIELYRQGADPASIHNCCSGKHTGFLTVARHHEGQPAFALPGYLDPSHGVQRLVTHAQAAFTGEHLDEQVPVVDGCGIPVFRFPLVSLARAMARLVSAEHTPAGFEDAAARTAAALPSRALLVSGTGRAEQVLTGAATEPVILKGGAEGVFMAALPERGVGLALKCADGAGRGADEALAALLHHLDVTPDRVAVHSPVRNRAGDAVGEIRVHIP